MKRRGFTLVELIIATALLSVITVIVFQFLRQFLRLWQKSEDRREVVEESSGLAELLADDFSALQNGARGRLLAEWCRSTRISTDCPILPAAHPPRASGESRRGAAPRSRRQDDTRARQGEALLEVCWALLAARAAARSSPTCARRDCSTLGTLARRRDALALRSDVLRAGQQAARRAQRRQRRDPLLGMEFATQTTLLDGRERGRWRIGADLEDAATSWDAWSKGRPDAVRHFWNQATKGMPAPGKRAALPRRAASRSSSSARPISSCARAWSAASPPPMRASTCRTA
jgi:prepilin-type N-terminal cleavage/methylation domain-containing protein